MLKWLLLFVLAYAAYQWWLRASVTAKAPRNTEKGDEQMIACAQCGVNFPCSETVGFEGRSFCCEAHCTAWKQGR